MSRLQVPRLLHRLPVVLALALPALAGARPAAARSVLDDPRFHVEVKRGLAQLYGMDFAGADATFGQIAARYPGHPVGPFLAALSPWWSILLDPDDESGDEAFLAAMEEVLERAERRLDADPDDIDGMFFKTGAHAFRGRLYTVRERWYRAAQDGRHALTHLHEVVERDPDNDDLYFGLGIFDYMADVVPDRYPVLKPFAAFFPEGDRERGLAELRRAIAEGHFVPTEARFALLQIHYQFEKDYGAALADARWLRARHPGNSLFHLYEGRVLARAKRPDEAARVYSEVLTRHARRQSGYTDSLAEQALFGLARLDVGRKRWAAALTHLDRLERLGARRRVVTEEEVMGRLWQGMALDALGRRDEAVRRYRQVQSMKGVGDSRAKARRYLSRPFRG